MAEDAQLLEAYARRGDVGALTALVERHSKWLGAFVRGLAPNDAEAEDAAQDVWVRVIRSCGGYRGGSVRAYLARVARSVVIDRFRRSRPALSLDEEAEEADSLVETLADGAATPDAAFEARAGAEEIREMVRKLPEGPRGVFLMRAEGELAFKEIAAEMKIPLGTALTWMHVATVRLRKMMGERHE